MITTTTWLPNPGPCGMRYSDRLRAWCTARHVKLHERVLADGRHHVWFCAIAWRYDFEHRDFEQACRVLWSYVDRGEVVPA